MVDLYRALVRADAERDELLDDGAYVPATIHSRSPDGRLAHVIQGSNKLAAALDLVARATVLSERDDHPVVQQPGAAAQ